MGELLLHTLFEYSLKNGFNSLFVEVNESQAKLVSFLQSFGFQQQEKINPACSDLVYGKNLVPPENPGETVSPIEFYNRYGPKFFVREGIDYHVVPIEPRFHDRLFPFLAEQQSLFGGLEACGNTIKKAYFCNSNTKKLNPGDVLLFYRSSDTRSIGCMGIVEDALRSSDADELIAFMSDRTVYCYDEIAEKVSETSALAIRFSRIFLDMEPIPFSVLRDQGLLSGAPQTITTIKPEHHQWLQQKVSPQ